MKRLMMACGMVLMSSVPAYAADASADIPVDRVILSTSGLANFVHRADVTGAAQLEFPVRLEQVDDILKSLVVFDASGRLGGVTLPGRQPLDQAFRDLPFNRGALNNPAQLLNAYQGADVTLGAGKEALAGKLLRVDTAEEVDDKGFRKTRYRISLMTDSGMRQTAADNIDGLRFSDAKIRDEISRALDAVRENGTSGRRVLTVNLAGDGKRDVSLSYVVDAPLWKSAYRMVVPETGKTEGLLQGWAVVENMTASDWNNVDLTLVSDNPVTFRQALYESYYVSRPEIPVQVFGRVMPRVDRGSVATAADMESDMVMQAEDVMEKSMRAAPAPASPQMMRAKEERNMMMESAAMAGGAATYDADTSMESLAVVANAAQSAEATTQVLFRFPERFSLRAGQSMMVPFVSKSVPMERVSLYQPDTHATHPLAAVEIANNGDTGIPAGILTLYEESPVMKGTAFVGDAQLPMLAAGEKRMVSYALDSKVTIAREDKSVSTEGQYAVSRGVLRVSVKNRAETVYTIKAPEKESRTVVIEHPKRHDYTLVTPDPKNVDATDAHYRLRVPVAAGEKKVFAVVLENTGWQSYGIDGMDADTLQAFATTRGKLPEKTRRQFEKLASLRAEMQAVERKIYALDEKRNIIFQDQERVRQNLQALSGKSDVRDKYLSKLSAQEDDIAKIDAEKQNLSAELAEKRAALQDAVLKIEL